MRYLEFDLRDHFPGLPGDAATPILRCYLRDNPESSSGLRRLPAVVAFPGGGFRYLSNREGEPVALRFLSEGCNAFVLYYSCLPTKYPALLLQALAAVAFIRRNAEEWGVDASRISVCGFSAGAMLAGMTGVHWKNLRLTSKIGVKPEECRPDGLIMAYGAMPTALPEGSRLLDDSFTPEERRELCSGLFVDGDTPRAFVWHTFEDAKVPVGNALEIGRLFLQAGVPFELHIYPQGEHGQALCDITTSSTPSMFNPHAAGWVKQCVEWLDLISGK